VTLYKGCRFVSNPGRYGAGRKVGKRVSGFARVTAGLMPVEDSLSMLAAIPKQSPSGCRRPSCREQPDVDSEAAVEALDDFFKMR
jgi:hypothetical protein